MTYKITNITESTVYLIDQNDVEYSEKLSEYDTLMINIGYEFEADTHLPYDISSQRRLDICSYIKMKLEMEIYNDYI